MPGIAQSSRGRGLRGGRQDGSRSGRALGRGGGFDSPNGTGTVSAAGDDGGWGDHPVPVGGGSKANVNDVDDGGWGLSKGNVEPEVVEGSGWGITPPMTTTAADVG